MVRHGGRSLTLAATLVGASLVVPAARADGDGIVLSADWNAPAVALSWIGTNAPFDVYRSPNPSTVFDPSMSLIGTTPSTTWTDTPPAGTIFFYGVKNTSDSSRIATARSAPDGPTSVTLLGSLVTYVKPAVGSEPAGFFVQAAPTGPGLFVAIDPATLVPVPAAGDRATFTVTAMGTLNGLREAVSISGYARLSVANPLGGLVQNVSGSGDLVSNLGGYDSELITISGIITQALSSEGTGFVAGNLDTAGLAGDPNLRFRTTTTIANAYDIVSACQITVTGTPLWRFNATAEPTAWAPSELTAIVCPAPKVIGAVALSATSVGVDFDRHIDPASVVASGSQFLFDNGLVATGAAVSGRRVTVTTSAQIPSAAYTVSVASSVTDTIGASVDSASNHASFNGYVSLATIVINEANPNITGGKDLLELLVVLAGSTAGWTLEQGVASPVSLATLPDMPVAAGDIIVVHMTPGATEGPASETASKNQYPRSTYANNYDTAWDVNGNVVSIAFSDRVIALRYPGGALADAVPFVLPAGSPVASFPADLQAIQAAGFWLPADCGGIACTNTTFPSAKDLSVSWAGCGTTPIGNSVQRLPSVDTNMKSDWKAVGASTFGGPNSP